MRVLFDVSGALDAFIVQLIDQTIETVTTDLVLTVCTEHEDLAQSLKRKYPERVRTWTPSLISPAIDRCLWRGFVSQFGADVFMLSDPDKLGCVNELPAPAIVVSPQTVSVLLESVPQAIQTAIEAHKVQSAPGKPKLALVSPILPAKSGIADYTADMLPALSELYDITLIDTTPAALRDWDQNDPDRAAVRDVDWFTQNHDQFDRVVYQVGNSEFHEGMLQLLQRIPGIAQLHDFFLGDYLSWEQTQHGSTMWYETLVYEHGFKALELTRSDPNKATLVYPVNRRVFRDSLGIIVHSQYAKQLALKHIGLACEDRTSVINLFRNPITPPSMAQAREALGLGAEDFIVCCFGFIGPLKLHDRLIAAWAASDLARDARAKLVLVGQSLNGAFSQHLQASINALDNPAQVVITGFASAEDFKLYLSAANYAVQLRTNSRGETSGVVSHALNHGLPLIVNANGSFAEIDSQAAIILPDEFDNAMLVQAMNDLYHDPEQRRLMAERGPIVMQQMNSPARCAQLFRNAVELAYQKRLGSHPQQILRAISQEPQLTVADRNKLASIIDQNRAVDIVRRRFFVDITATHRTTLQSGIERVAIELCRALIELEPELGIVTPVYLTEHEGRWRHCQANEFMIRDLGFHENWLADHEAQPRSGDILLTLDLAPVELSQASAQGLLRRYRARGVHCYSIVYDLLPISLPSVFPPGVSQRHEQWAKAVCDLDGALCISKHVASELQQWRARHQFTNPRFKVSSFLLGANTETFVNDSRAYDKLPLSFVVSNAPAMRHPSSGAATFLMVGTIEPRKGYLETIQAFSELWQEGFEGRLVIVGREGWRGLPDDQRHNIPQTVELLTTHPQLQKRLWWLNDADDAMLKIAYACSDCLIAASYDEGFGLPIVEATRHAVPVLARNLPVFREVAPQDTQFFNDGELIHAIRHWRKPASPPQDRHTITWRQSAQQVLQWVSASTEQAGDHQDAMLDL